jgi:hypothetical protein
MLLSAHRRHGTGRHRVLLVCDKPDTTVQRFVAGPGVYISNECIELSTTIVADVALTTPEESSRRRSQYFDRSAEDILATPPALVSSADRVESESTTGWISRLRERGTDWRTIADAVGMTVDAAC